MTPPLRSGLLILLFLLAMALPGSASDWKNAIEFQGKAYFFVPLPNRVERYDLASKTWLPSISLPSGFGALSTGTVDADGIYVAYDKATYRYDLSGSNQVHILTTSDPVVALHTDGSVLFINHSVSLYARVKSISKANNTLIAAFENYIDAIGGSSIAPSLNKLFGRSLGVSPSDITYVSYTDAGQFGTGGDSPHHGDYPSATRTWVFPDDGRVVDDSGTIYSTSSLSYVGSLGGTVNALAFYGGNIPIVARGTELIAYNAGLLPTGSKLLGYAPKAIFMSGTDVATFISTDAAANGIEAALVPVNTLNPPTPGEPVDPRGISYTPAATWVDKDGILYLFSKTHQSIFRWNSITQDYGATIPLVGIPEYAAYSRANHTIYLAYQSGLIRSIDLAAPTLSEVPFAALPTPPLGLATADQYVFACDSSGAWNTHYTFAPTGTLVKSVDWNYYSKEYIWSSVRQKMYFFRDDSSPNDVLWEEINANGTAYPGLPAGGIGTYKDSPLHTSEGFLHPLRISPDGGLVVLGSGMMHDAVSLARMSTTLANSVTDIDWVGNSGAISTIRTIAGTTQFQKWNAPTFGLGTVVQVPGTAHALKALNDGTSLVGVTIGTDGAPSFYVLSENFGIIPPATLTAPTNLRTTGVASTTIDLAWADVSGESTFSVERKTGQGGAWAEVGTTTTSVCAFKDSGVASGNTYSYRVIAKNGALSSLPSTVLEISVLAPTAPATITATSLSSSEIQVAWTDADIETDYLLERRALPSGSWSQRTSLLANVLTFKDTGLSSNTTYEYRVRAQNGIGTSAYSPTASAKTNAVAPSAPYLYSPTASDPYGVTLSWYIYGTPDRSSIFRRLSGETAWTALTTVQFPQNTYTDTTVSPATTYQYMVNTANSAGTSPNSSIVSVTTPALPKPTAPANFVAKTVSAAEIALKWVDALYETGYRVERRLGEGQWEAIATPQANAISYQDTTVAAGGFYTYRIIAVNAQGETSSAEDTAVAEALVALYADDFDPALQPGLWESITGAQLNSGAGFRDGNALWFNENGTRSAITFPLKIGSNTHLQFAFRAGNEAADGPDWDDSEPNERVLVEYSVNGFDWVLLQPLATLSPAHSTWTNYSLELPAAAQTLGTRIRWRQEAHSGVGTDQWAIEDVVLAGPSAGGPITRINPVRELPPTSAPWTSAAEHDGIAYFLFDTPAKIERYDLANSDWLSPICLPDGPHSLVVGDDGIYVGFGYRVSRFSFDGALETVIISAGTEINPIGATNGLLYLSGDPTWGSARFGVASVLTGKLLAEVNYDFGMIGISYAASKRRFFGRSALGSERDIVQLELRSTGLFEGQADSPYASSYPDATRTYLSPDESLVIDDSGTAYFTQDLTYAGSLGGRLDDLAFAGANPVVLRDGNTVAGYSSEFERAGSKTVPGSYVRMFISGEVAHLFSRAEGRGVEAFTLSLAGIVPSIPREEPVPGGKLGSYFASLTADLSSEGPIGGDLRLTLSADGAASGSVRIGGKTVRFKTSFDAAGNATAVLRFGSEELSLTLNLSTLAGTSKLTGKLQSEDWSFAITGYRGVSETIPAQVPFLLTDSTELPRNEVPPVIGRGSMAIAKSGNVRVTGALLLGGAVTQATHVTEDGSIFLALRTKDGNSTVIGTVAPADTADADFAGSLQWHKRPKSPSDTRKLGAVRYGAEIRTAIDFRGVKYPAAKSPLVLSNSRSVTIILEGGDLRVPMLVPGVSYLNGLIVAGYSQKAIVAGINRNTGMVSGTFPHPSGGAGLPFGGIVNPKLNEIQGGFMGPLHGGRVRIVPGVLAR